ncbi:MAG: hypothetical protein ACI4AN_00910 [Muribaculaceae bacterium]
MAVENTCYRCIISLPVIRHVFKKVVIVKDHIMPRRNEDGILTIGLFDFLLQEDSLDI